MTKQIRDTLIHNGKTHSIHPSIVSRYFEKHPEKNPKRKTFFSALMRGYICESIITENKLYIQKIDAFTGKKSSGHYADVLSEVFPDPANYFLNWYNGIIQLTDVPKPDHPDSYRQAPVHDYNELLEIRNGILTATRVFNYDELKVFEKSQFQAFKKSEKYQQLLNAAIERTNNRNNTYRESGETEHLYEFDEPYFERLTANAILQEIDRFY